MKNLLCEHPAIILNHDLKHLVLRHGNYCIRGEFVKLAESTRLKWYNDFPWSVFGTKNNGITVDDIDGSYVLDCATGDMIPIYMAVPCNKCSLCRDKKAREWSTRAMCESQESSGYPLFVTLTYNDLCKPANGVEKKHVVKFMKRLRINLQREGFNVNLRMFLCAEYGSKTKRPHYHLLLWNFPQLRTLKETLSILEKSWSFVVAKKNLKNYGYCFKDSVANRWRVPYGFVHVQLAQGGHVKYCMKYMRKDIDKPEGANDIFYLSSRRRGIGYTWFEKHKQEFVDNPKLLDIQFVDKFSCATYKAAMPQYFKDLLYPTLSRIIPKNVRDDYGLFLHLLAVRRSLMSDDFMSSNEMNVLVKYANLPNYFPADVDGLHSSYVKEKTNDYTTYIPFYLPSQVKKYTPRMDLVSVTAIPHIVHEDVSDDVLNDIILRLTPLTKKLLSYNYDAAIYDDSKHRKCIRQYYLLRELESKPELSVNDAVREVHAKRQRQLNVELF